MSLVSPAFPPVATPPARAPLKSLDTALAELLAHAAPLTGLETVATFDADGRVLAQDLFSSLEVPAHDNSVKSGDGFRIFQRCGVGQQLGQRRVQQFERRAGRGSGCNKTHGKASKT